MKKLSTLFYIIICSLILQIFSLQRKEITFKATSLPPTLFFDKADTYIVKASFTKENYLYIYPIYRGQNKGVFKTYFKKYNETDIEANMLNSDYSTLEVNSGLFIDSTKLDYDVANIFIVGLGQINFYMAFSIVNGISFPSSTLINQFLLLKGQSMNIKFTLSGDQNDGITVLSKYSLRNIEIELATDEGEIITFNNGGYVYPNGYSFIFARKLYPAGRFSLTISNDKKINSRDEIIILGFTKYNEDDTFPNSIVNGFQLYMDKVYYNLWNLNNSLTNPFYYNYQIYAKNVEFAYIDSAGKTKGRNQIVEYNSMVCSKIDTFKMTFTLEDLKEIIVGIFIQFFDFNNLEIVQKALQPLVSGLPKSMLIPAGKSLYHFLPVLEDTKEIHYYLRSKVQNSKIYVSFKTCQSYPDKCFFTEKLSTATSAPLIDNIGMWFTENKTDSSLLKLIYIYCETECAYDILMTYNEDPLFVYPDNNYTKFLGENKRDIFALPVFEYLSKFDELKIDLSILSGKAKLTLYESLENLMNNNPIGYVSEIIDNRQSYIITKSTFSSASYYKRELYALVEGDIGSFYNLMYTTGSKGNKILDNNRVFTDIIKVGVSEEKIYTYENKRNDFYISITTHNCKSKVMINDKEQSNQDKHHLYKFSDKKIYEVKILLINDEEICENNFEDHIMIYTYNSDNTNILLSENTPIWSSFIGSKINFNYYFNPNSVNGDNSYNLEIERLSQTQLSFEYKLERISFDKTQAKNTQKYSFSQTVVSKKSNIITTDKILSICNNLNKNEICGLTMSFIPSSNIKETFFSFYLNKNSNNYAFPLTQETLINSVNSDKAKYYYIDLNKNYDIEIIVNSFGNDLEFNYDISQDKSKTVIPFSNFENAKGFHLIHINKNDYASCGSFCRVYLGVHMPKTEKVSYTSYSISYFFINENKQKSDINLAFNYHSRYKFDNLEEITYTLHSYDASNIVLELSNESSNVNLKGTVTYSGNSQQIKPNEKLYINNIQGEVKISIPNPGKDTSYKIKANSIGKKLNSAIYPVLSSFAEKCIIENKNSACYYLVDITSDLNYNHLFLFAPESEEIYISIQELELGYVEKPNTDMNTYLTTSKDYTYSSKAKMQRPNWYEYRNVNESKSLLVRVASLIDQKIESNLYASFSTKPNSITLNNAEKRIFNIKEDETNEININIPKASGTKTKYKIKIHAIKGNGVFSILGQTYSLGLQSTFKEDMTIIIDSNQVDKNLLLKASNKYDEKEVNEFVFSVEYIAESRNKLLYEIENAKINSYKFYSANALSIINFYMKANSTLVNNKRTYKDINMNIKIYTKNAEFDVKSYIVDENTLEKCLNDSIQTPGGNMIGNIKNFITGGKNENGELTLSKLEIESDKFNEYINENNQLYVYLIFTQKDGSQNNRVNINIYSYDINNNKALAWNELFIQKIPAKSLNYQLLLVKMDLFWDNDLIVEYSHPSSKKYDYGAMHSENKNNEIARTKDIIRTSSTLNNGNSELLLNSRNVALRYLLFNIYANENNLENNPDYFLFKYRQSNIGKNIYYEDCNLDFNVTGSTNKLTFHFTTYNPRYKTGSSVIIIKGYQKSSISEETNVFTLFFSDNDPIFTHHIIGKTKDQEEVSTQLSGGEYTFACLQVIEDNEREEYIGHQLSTVKIESTNEEDSPENGIIDYIKNHVFATVVIIIVVILFIGIMINICRHERKSGKVEINVNEVEGGLVDS